MNGQIQGPFTTHPREKVQIKRREEPLCPQIAGELQILEVSKSHFEIGYSKVITV